ncbi:HD domain-containing protein [Pleurocapsa sp. PCC 7319]|uniref:HD domain-containing protein n=1 Tax=Pleurocapsa sp. PCC 7319 TaxID=118161 RepID=UPI00034D6B76|nr:HD domain-containing protein [Pleurocapsa sp. PCC 7319]
MLSDRFTNAIKLAAELHSSQLRKGTNIPYISHLLGVTSLVLEHGGHEDEAIAAMLHDAVEDQGGWETLARIESQFGANVAAIVQGCTDSYETPKPAWRSRKENYIKRLAKTSASVRLVSNADKLHNARAILNDLRVCGEPLWQRFSGGREGTLWYYKSLANTFKELNNGALAEELDRVVREIERISQVE